MTFRAPEVLEVVKCLQSWFRGWLRCISWDLAADRANLFPLSCPLALPARNLGCFQLEGLFIFSIISGLSNLNSKVEVVVLNTKNVLFFYVRGNVSFLSHKKQNQTNSFIILFFIQRHISLRTSAGFVILNDFHIRRCSCLYFSEG